MRRGHVRGLVLVLVPVPVLALLRDAIEVTGMIEVAGRTATAGRLAVVAVAVNAIAAERLGM